MPAISVINSPLCILTSVKIDQTWNKTNHEQYERAKTLIRKDVCMKFYNEKKPLYLETDVSAIGLGAGPLQV